MLESTQTHILGCHFESTTWKAYVFMINPLQRLMNITKMQLFLLHRVVYEWYFKNIYVFELVNKNCFQLTIFTQCKI